MIVDELELELDVDGVLVESVLLLLMGAELLLELLLRLELLLDTSVDQVEVEKVGKELKLLILGRVRVRNVDADCDETTLLEVGVDKVLELVLIGEAELDGVAVN